MPENVRTVELKGRYMGACNRSACLMPGANWLNQNNDDTYYCQSCAFKLNDANRHHEFWKPLTWDRWEKLTAGQFLEDIRRKGASTDRAIQFHDALIARDIIQYTLAREEWERLYLEEIL